jgi:hypothetical protein
VAEADIELLEFIDKKIKGLRADKVRAEANITTNKNIIENINNKLRIYLKVKQKIEEVG